MAFRQVRTEEQRQTTIAMRYARKYPKLQYSTEELPWLWNRYLAEVHLDAVDGLRLLAEADTLIHVEIPDMITARYMRLDWSVIPRRTAVVLMVLLDMQRTDGPRLIAPTREIIRRAELMDADLLGWKPARGSWSPKVVMDALTLLQRMGLLDELTPGDPGKNEWSDFYPQSNRATIVSIARDPQQPTLRVRGHLRPSVWSVAVGSYLTSNLDITPATTQTPKALAVGYYGRAVSNFDDPVMTMDELHATAEDADTLTMWLAKVHYRRHHTLAAFLS